MNNCLITKRGRIIKSDSGTDHERTCKRIFGYTLRTFLLRKGGTRIKVCWPDTTSIAIEYHDKPTSIQQGIIHKILRENDYYTIVLGLKVISKFRPIRSFQV